MSGFSDKKGFLISSYILYSLYNNDFQKDVSIFYQDGVNLLIDLTQPNNCVNNNIQLKVPPKLVPFYTYLCLLSNSKKVC